jgi:hypothetical protein
MISAAHLLRAAKLEAETFAAVERVGDSLEDAEARAAKHTEAEGHQRAARVLLAWALAALVVTVACPLWLALASAEDRDAALARSASWAAYAATPGLDAVPLAEARRQESLAASRADRESPWLGACGLYVVLEGVCGAAVLAIRARR